MKNIVMVFLFWKLLLYNLTKVIVAAGPCKFRSGAQTQEPRPLKWVYSTGEPLFEHQPMVFFNYGRTSRRYLANGQTLSM